MVYCPRCGTQLPDDAVYCIKCGASVNPTGTASQPQVQSAPRAPVIAPMGATSMKCPNCGAPISPKFGEMVITCEYCGSGITLGNDGWSSIQKQTMLLAKFTDKDQMTDRIRQLMDQGLMHRHLQESSVLVDLNLSLVPYWIVPVSARTSVVATSMVMEAANVATTAALFSVMAGGFRRSYPLAPTARFGMPFSLGFGGASRLGMMLGGFGMMGGGGGNRKTAELDNNYNFPVVALKALSEYQPKNYTFNLAERTLFDLTKVPKGTPVLNGDIGEEDAKNQARTFVSQVQSDKAHSQYHMIQQLNTEMDVGDGELLHAPIWFAKYTHKGDDIVLIMDANTGTPVNVMGLS
jgi:hypothetical protein